MRNRYTLRAFASLLTLLALAGNVNLATASSHREAPSISNDPVADNTDLYAFRSPDKPNTITIIANYIPFEVPYGGPNYFTFGDDVRYEIHIKNKASGSTDDITYRFTFSKTNEDPTTFFNIRLGKQNLKTTYMVQRSRDGGNTWTTIVQPGTGIVPANNIGPRSIDSKYGLNTPYETLSNNAINTSSGSETIFCGPVDDPFFVDLQGIFDLGGFDSVSRDGLAGFNCHTIAMQIPISMLSASGNGADPNNILDPSMVIGVWASSSRQAIRTLNGDGTSTNSGNWIQVSRLGMPLTNEAIIPIGMKDKWNSFTPMETAKELATAPFFVNPELALYVGNGPYSAAIPGLAKLRLDTNSLGGGFDFRNGKIGLYGLYGNPATNGTALDTSSAGFGKILLQPASPRSVDLLPIFFTGVPNLAPYQLATGKTGGPLSAGKPFINNFLPTLGDMLRLNMAVPPTPRTSADFSSDGLITAAVLGLTDQRFTGSTAIQNIPNMDGFPNGRRLEDDVTRIEMQAVGGLVLNAIGLWTDDYKAGQSPVTTQLYNKVSWTAGVEKNDVPLRPTFPYEALPHRGTDGLMTDLKAVLPYAVMGTTGGVHIPNSIGVHVGNGLFTSQNYPNPTTASTQLNYHTKVTGVVTIKIYDMRGYEVSTLANEHQTAGDYSVTWSPSYTISNGNYVAVLYVDGEQAHQLKISLQR